MGGRGGQLMFGFNEKSAKWIWSSWLFWHWKQNINGAMDLKAISSLCKYQESRCIGDIIRKGMWYKNISVLSQWRDWYDHLELILDRGTQRALTSAVEKENSEVTYFKASLILSAVMCICFLNISRKRFNPASWYINVIKLSGRRESWSLEQDEYLKQP